MNKDMRKHLVALYPCGCVCIIMTTEDPQGHTVTVEGKVRTVPPYKASAKDIADFYATVHKRQTRKKNPLALEVVTSTGRPEFPWGCDKCQPSKIVSKQPAGLFDGGEVAS